MEIRSEPLSVSDLFEGLTTILKPLAEQRKVHILSTVDPDVPILHSDPGKLQQVLYNFLSNAIKFSPDHGRVEVRVSPEGAESLCVEVQDWGIGIKDEDVHRLFIEFQQLDASTAKHYKGTGLGLALTKRIVEAQGGTVGVRTQPGSGSTFFAKLPKRATARTADIGWANGERRMPQR
jgi:signal transduction histidine kinase